ncbi:uncharacterized protein [Venturia canescens]|uniref:uncharacterized protein n=1 Tax=Venturia canescens TaxID=32260 RepID=UPI001C9C864E|nr:uncharacterized protein LOC122409272 [Venturia canescens]
MKSYLALVVLVAFFASGEALKCYNCHDEPKNTTCGDSFKPSDDLLKECWSGEQCTKQVLVTSKNGTFVVRGCGKPEDLNFGPSAGSKIKGMGIKDAEVHFCDNDKCNGAGSLAATVVTTMGLAVLAAKWN